MLLFKVKIISKHVKYIVYGIFNAIHNLYSTASPYDVTNSLKVYSLNGDQNGKSSIRHIMTFRWLSLFDSTVK